MDKKERIEQLKKEKDAVILAHYYVEPEIQALADYVGDSFYLSKVAVELSSRNIVFCGVSFMGESGKLLNPDKNVLLPDITADCPMAHMVTKKTVEEARKKYDDLAVVCYINSTAEIKSWSDVCVTSANAVKIVKNLPNKYILFIPDRNLAHFVAKQVPEKVFIYNEGFCPIHEHMKASEIKALKEAHSSAKVLVHPECNLAVLEYADYIGSTSGIIKYVGESNDKEFIIGTEIGVEYALKKARPDAKFYFPSSRPVCTDMKKITLDKIIEALENSDKGTDCENAVICDNEEQNKMAGKTLERMLELAAN